jgi:hypothetical protein
MKAFVVARVACDGRCRLMTTLTNPGRKIILAGSAPDGNSLLTVG